MANNILLDLDLDLDVGVDVDVMVLIVLWGGVRIGAGVLKSG
jgi:hypothetical protein